MHLYLNLFGIDSRKGEPKLFNQYGKPDWANKVSRFDVKTYTHILIAGQIGTMG